MSHTPKQIARTISANLLKGGAKMSCGCHYAFSGDAIQYCPLHAAAPALLGALEKIAAWGGDGMMTDTGFRAEATTVARAAILAMKGEK